MPDHLYAPWLALEVLGECWYITAACVAIFAALLWRRPRPEPWYRWPEVRAIGPVYTWPLAALVAGIAFVNVDDWWDRAGFIGLCLGAAMFLGNCAHLTIVIRRGGGNRSVLLAAAPLQLWVALACSMACSTTLSGFGRHWR